MNCAVLKQFFQEDALYDNDALGMRCNDTVVILEEAKAFSSCHFDKIPSKVFSIKRADTLGIDWSYIHKCAVIASNEKTVLWRHSPSKIRLNAGSIQYNYGKHGKHDYDSCFIIDIQTLPAHKIKIHFSKPINNFEGFFVYELKNGALHKVDAKLWQY